VAAAFIAAHIEIVTQQKRSQLPLLLPGRL
jgi:hypothetical protein